MAAKIIVGCKKELFFLNKNQKKQTLRVEKNYQYHTHCNPVNEKIETNGYKNI